VSSSSLPCRSGAVLHAPAAKFHEGLKRCCGTTWRLCPCGPRAAENCATHLMRPSWNFAAEHEVPLPTAWQNSKKTVDLDRLLRDGRIRFARAYHSGPHRLFRSSDTLRHEFIVPTRFIKEVVVDSPELPVSDPKQLKQHGSK